MTYPKCILLAILLLAAGETALAQLSPCSPFANNSLSGFTHSSSLSSLCDCHREVENMPCHDSSPCWAENCIHITSSVSSGITLGSTYPSNCIIIEGNGVVVNALYGSTLADCVVVRDGASVSLAIELKGGNDVLIVDHADVGGIFSNDDDNYISIKGSTLGKFEGGGGSDLLHISDTFVSSGTGIRLGDAGWDCVRAANLSSSGNITLWGSLAREQHSLCSVDHPSMNVSVNVWNCPYDTCLLSPVSVCNTSSLSAEYLLAEPQCTPPAECVFDTHEFERSLCGRGKPCHTEQCVELTMNMMDLRDGANIVTESLGTKMLSGLDCFVIGEGVVINGTLEITSSVGPDADICVIASSNSVVHGGLGERTPSLSANVVFVMLSNATFKGSIYGHDNELFTKDYYYLAGGSVEGSNIVMGAGNDILFMCEMSLSNLQMASMSNNAAEIDLYAASNLTDGTYSLSASALSICDLANDNANVNNSIFESPVNGCLTSVCPKFVTPCSAQYKPSLGADDFHCDCEVENFADAPCHELSTAVNPCLEYTLSDEVPCLYIDAVVVGNLDKFSCVYVSSSGTVTGSIQAPSNFKPACIIVNGGTVTGSITGTTFDDVICISNSSTVGNAVRGFNGNDLIIIAGGSQISSDVLGDDGVDFMFLSHSSLGGGVSHLRGEAGDDCLSVTESQLGKIRGGIGDRDFCNWDKSNATNFAMFDTCEGSLCAPYFLNTSFTADSLCELYGAQTAFDSCGFQCYGAFNSSSSALCSERAGSACHAPSCAILPDDFPTNIHLGHTFGKDVHCVYLPESHMFSRIIYGSLKFNNVGDYPPGTGDCVFIEGTLNGYGVFKEWDDVFALGESAYHASVSLTNMGDGDDLVYTHSNNSLASVMGTDGSDSVFVCNADIGAGKFYGGGNDADFLAAYNSSGSINGGNDEDYCPVQFGNTTSTLCDEVNGCFDVVKHLCDVYSFNTCSVSESCVCDFFNAQPFFPCYYSDGRNNTRVPAFNEGVYDAAPCNVEDCIRITDSFAGNLMVGQSQPYESTCIIIDGAFVSGMVSALNAGGPSCIIVINNATVDSVSGSNFNDFIFVSDSQVDFVYGRDGADVIRVQNSAVDGSVNGGAGNDVISACNCSVTNSKDLAGGDGSDCVSSQDSNFFRLLGSGGDDFCSNDGVNYVTDDCEGNLCHDTIDICASGLLNHAAAAASCDNSYYDNATYAEACGCSNSVDYAGNPFIEADGELCAANGALRPGDLCYLMNGTFLTKLTLGEDVPEHCVVMMNGAAVNPSTFVSFSSNVFSRFALVMLSGSSIRAYGVEFPDGNAALYMESSEIMSDVVFNNGSGSVFAADSTIDSFLKLGGQSGFSDGTKTVDLCGTGIGVGAQFGPGSSCLRSVNGTLAAILKGDDSNLYCYSDNSNPVSSDCNGNLCYDLFGGTASPPSLSPTSAPTRSPTRSPSKAPTPSPTDSPSNSPTRGPTTAPVAEPTQGPTIAPAAEPTQGPTIAPAAEPTQGPSTAPSRSPTRSPTTVPTRSPTRSPTTVPTRSPTWSPTQPPSIEPNAAPSTAPSTNPSIVPTVVPSTSPSFVPTVVPSWVPSTIPAFVEEPSPGPTFVPTLVPTYMPVVLLQPSLGPTFVPSVVPIQVPSAFPTSRFPSRSPTASPTTPNGALVPTISPTVAPDVQTPTLAPSVSPTPPTQLLEPTARPSDSPTNSTLDKGLDGEGGGDSFPLLVVVIAGVAFVCSCALLGVLLALRRRKRKAHGTHSHDAAERRSRSISRNDVHGNARSAPVQMREYAAVTGGSGAGGGGNGSGNEYASLSNVRRDRTQTTDYDSIDSSFGISRASKRNVLYDAVPQNVPGASQYGSLHTAMTGNSSGNNNNDNTNSGIYESVGQASASAQAASSYDRVNDYGNIGLHEKVAPLSLHYDAARKPSAASQYDKVTKKPPKRNGNAAAVVQYESFAPDEPGGSVYDSVNSPVGANQYDIRALAKVAANSTYDKISNSRANVAGGGSNEGNYNSLGLKGGGGGGGGGGVFNTTSDYDAIAVPLVSNTRMVSPRAAAARSPRQLSRQPSARRSRSNSSAKKRGVPAITTTATSTSNSSGRSGSGGGSGKKKRASRRASRNINSNASLGGGVGGGGGGINILGGAPMISENANGDGAVQIIDAPTVAALRRGGRKD